MSFRNILKSKGRKIKQCGTTAIIFFQEVNGLLTLTQEIYFLSNYTYIKMHCEKIHKFVI